MIGLKILFIIMFFFLSSKSNAELSNFEKGKNYYFITGVNSDNVLGAVLGGAIGSAVVGGPFPTQQVNKETFDRLKNN